MDEENKQAKFFDNKWFLSILALIAVVGLAYIVYNDRQVANPLPRLGATDQDQQTADQSLRENLEAVSKAQRESFSLVASIGSADHYLGEIGSPLELIYYSDASSPFSNDIASTVEQVRQAYGGQALVGYRHYLGEDSPLALLAAGALECGAEQGEGNFWPLLGVLSDLNTSANLNQESILAEVEALNLSMPDFEACLAEGRYVQKILDQTEAAEKYGVSGVPTIFVNKLILPGAYPFEDFVDSAGFEREGLKSIIDKELNK